jgi:hypothetical protein
MRSGIQRLGVQLFRRDVAVVSRKQKAGEREPLLRGAQLRTAQLQREIGLAGSTCPCSCGPHFDFSLPRPSMVE